jgi:chromosomal replication initiation ATPase DnaA
MIGSTVQNFDEYDVDGFTITPNAKEHLVSNSNRDVRAIREALETATSIDSANNTKVKDIEIAEEAV